METTYEKITTEFGNEIIKRTDKNKIISFIPSDLANSDYQEYLKYLEENNG